jgi:hypothetical protein
MQYRWAEMGALSAGRERVYSKKGISDLNMEDKLPCFTFKIYSDQQKELKK